MPSTQAQQPSHPHPVPQQDNWKTSHMSQYQKDGKMPNDIPHLYSIWVEIRRIWATLMFIELEKQQQQQPQSRKGAVKQCVRTTQLSQFSIMNDKLWSMAVHQNWFQQKKHMVGWSTDSSRAWHHSPSVGSMSYSETQSICNFSRTVRETLLNRSSLIYPCNFEQMRWDFHTGGSWW